MVNIGVVFVSNQAIPFALKEEGPFMFSPINHLHLKGQSGLAKKNRKIMLGKQSKSNLW